MLYIPHGSDERSLPILKRILNNAFISHMVQMKESPVKKISFDRNLYIPHGSDESSVHCNASSNPSASFISHMVQMKEKAEQAQF